MPTRLAALVAAAVALSQSAFAQDSSGAKNPETALQDRVGLGIGFGKFDGDFYIQTTANLELNFGKIGLGLSAPLNILAYSNVEPPTRAEKAYFGFVRKTDWDELSDFGKLVRYVRYGQKREPIYFQAGELWGASIGHGTIVNRYTNAMQRNHKRLGLAFDINTGYGGGETLLDNVFSPTVIGGRAYVRPLSFILGSEAFLAERLGLGVSVIGDRLAPRTYKLVDANSDGIAAEPKVTAEFDMGEPDQIQAQLAAGIDLEFVVLESAIVDIIPYLDLNRLVGTGNGLHAGVLFDFEFPLVLKLNISTRLEYRLMGAGYIPVYFDNFYDIQRYAYLAHLKTGDELLPKATALRRMRDTGDTIQGVYGEAVMDLMGWLQVGLIYEDYQGENNASIGSFVALPAFDSIQLTAAYYRKNFEGLEEAIKLDERSILMGSVRVNVWGPIFFSAAFNRTWKTNPGPPTTLEAKNDFNFGADIDLPF